LGALTAPVGNVQCGLTQTFDIALASFRKLDDLLGDHFISEQPPRKMRGRLETRFPGRCSRTPRVLRSSKNGLLSQKPARLRIRAIEAS